MNFLKRAWRYSVAMYVKTLLLITVFAVVGTFVLTGLSIQSAAEKAKVTARQQLGTTVTLRTDVEKLREQQSKEGDHRGFMARVPIPMAQAELLTQSEFLKGYNLSVNVSALAKGFEPIEEKSGTSIQPGHTQEENTGDVRVQGVTSSKLVSNFQDGTYTLMDGEHFDQSNSTENVVLVSDILAEANEWKVGHTISVASVNDDAVLKLKIKGIFQSQVAEDEFDFRSPESSTSNLLFVPVETVSALQSEEQTQTISEATFYLNDPENIEKFKVWAEKQKVDWDNFTLDSNDAAYSQMMGPIENVSSFASYIVWIVFIAGALIIALVITLSIKGRRTEMGILLAIGESKAKLSLQFFAEILLVLTIGFTVASAISPIVAEPITNSLLAQQVEANEMQEQQGFSPHGGMGRGPGKDIANVEVVESLDVSVQVAEQVKLALLGLLLALISVSIPLIEIVRFSPKQILSKQE
ncbi:MAG: ABC transporter permease [Bacilli bacterium]